jgi:hypothetical protein
MRYQLSLCPLFLVLACSSEPDPGSSGGGDAEAEDAEAGDASLELEDPSSPDRDAGLEPDETSVPDYGYSGCHHDCWGGYLFCRDGETRLVGTGAVPCEVWEGECPSSVVYECEEGCRADHDPYYADEDNYYYNPYGDPLEEAAAGIDFGYRVVIDGEVTGVNPMPASAGGCDVPGASGLTVLERVFGDEQSWCICDTGLCGGDDPSLVTLASGEFAETFRWNGVNWTGPSDFGNPEGDPFPPGTYTVSVTAIGQQGAGEEAVSFEVLGTLEITLVP